MGLNPGYLFKSFLLYYSHILDHPARHPPLTHVVHKRGTFGDLLRGFLVESEPPARFRQHRQLASTPGTPIPQTTLTPGFHTVWTAKSVLSGSTSSVPNRSAGTFYQF